MPKPSPKSHEARVLDSMLGEFYLSKFYQTCTHYALPLPSTIQGFFSERVNDFIDYRDELLCVLGELLAFATFCGLNRVRARIAFRDLYDNPRFYDHMDEMIPRLRDWYLFFSGQKRVLTKKFRRDVKDMKKIRALFTRAPTEASKLYEADVRAGRHEGPISTGAIRLHYFSSLEQGKYTPGKDAKPDATMDLHVERHRGADLNLARKAWGLESLAVITDRAPFRIVFEPNNEDRLSPLAAYDLSNQFTKPIRVFEPRVSKMTAASRTIRSAGYPILYFMFTLLALFLGFPEKNTEYLGLIYGGKYATVYNSAGRLTTWLREGVWQMIKFIDRVMLYPLLLFIYVALTVKKVVVWSIKTTTSVIANSANAIFCASAKTASAIGVAATFMHSLHWKTWLVILAVCWFAIAEHHCSRF